MIRSNKKKCKHCKEFFIPDPRNASRQQYCSKLECRKASKAASQKRWLAKPENKDYFRGDEHKNRVYEWRKKNPGYRKSKTPKTENVFKDSLKTEPPDNKNEKSQITRDVLQDSLMEQKHVLVGFLSTFTGNVLQDSIDETIIYMRQLGKDIMNGSKNLNEFNKGDKNDIKTPNLSGTSTQSSQTFQLGGSPPGAPPLY